MINVRLGRSDARLPQTLVIALAVVYPVVAVLPTVEEDWLHTRTLSWTGR